MKYILMIAVLTLIACGSGKDDQMMRNPFDHGEGMSLLPETGKQGWQQSGVIRTGNATDRVSMQASFPRSGYYTVQFDVFQEDQTANASFNFVADVEWSVEGNTIRRRVSVGSGVTISGPGQAVRVVCQDNDTPPPLDVPFRVTIQVTPGTRPSVNNPPTLVDANEHLVAAGANIVVDIPQNVGVISAEVACAPIGAGAVPPCQIVVLFFNAAAAIKRYDVYQLSGFVAVPPNATQMTIFNLSAADDATVSITWGIDG